jgi:anhydro-N-acetylmuramic acid kinase
MQRHQGARYDRDGAWASEGKVDPILLGAFARHPYLALQPPKSAGREQFHMAWLDEILSGLGHSISPGDVQATLLELTATSLCDSVQLYCPGTSELYVCGGGAHNGALMRRLAALLPGVTVETTAALGIDPDWMEALAFAWLARQTLHHAPGNLPSVTGARGPRVLGALYPA